MDLQKGVVLVFSGPSGSGKSTMLSKLKEKNENLSFSISATTRLPRSGEVEGMHYFFKTTDAFEESIKNDDLLEWVTYCDHYYGTPRDFVLEQINQGKDIIIEVEVEGALKIKKNYPESVLVFVVPPSYEELIHRISKRGSESQKNLSKRMEIALKELKKAEEYDYIIVNDELNNAIRSLDSILFSEKLKINRKKSFLDSILKEGMSYERY